MRSRALGIGAGFLYVLLLFAILVGPWSLAIYDVLPAQMADLVATVQWPFVALFIPGLVYFVGRKRNRTFSKAFLIVVLSAVALLFAPLVLVGLGMFL